jgi:Rrf2 family cysteine metabolism transcriptional repressor
MRLMVELAKRYGDGPVSLHAIAEREDLPQPYLEQLASALRAAGLITGKRGVGGGYVLARPPSAIRAGDVIRALEGPIEPHICAAEGEPIVNCVREPFCDTRAVWVKLQESMVATLDGITLESLIGSHKRERES